MHRFSKLFALSAVSAILAACSGGGSTSSIPSAPLNPTTPQSVTTVPRAQVGSDGNVRVMFYNVGTERSGLVGGIVDESGFKPARRPRGGTNMTYHGGPIQTAPKMYLVLWGNWSTGDPNGEASYYQNFLSAIGASSWLSTVTQYTQSNGQTVGNASGSFAGSWNDTGDAIPNLNTTSYQNLLAAEAVKAAAHFGDYSSSASYIIALPHGVAVYQFAGNYSGTNGYCAWHASTTANGSTISYTNFPYIPDAGASCGSASVTSSSLDGVSIVGGHEQAETETDPQPNSGWLDGSGAEIGDKCAWVNLQNTSFGSASYPTQPLWSNAVTGCVQ